MEFSEQTELTNKIEIDPSMESRLTALEEVGGVEGPSKIGKKELIGQGQQCGDAGGCVGVQVSIRGILGNRKNTIKK